MRVFVTGATGFIGRALIPLLQRESHSIVAWVRSEARARSLLGASTEIVPSSAGSASLKKIFRYRGDVIRLRFGAT